MAHRPSSKPYRAYASIYERIGQGAFGAEMATRTLAWLANERSTRLRILDLACGTGAASLVFAVAGHQVVGVDRSLPMLDLAEDKADREGREVEFVEQDIRSLDITHIGGAASFNLVTCFFDSLNYLLNDNDLRRVCTRVGQALCPAGVFIFDLHTESELRSWDDRDEVVYDSDDLLVYNRLSYDDQRGRATGRVVWFERRDDRWWRNEEAHIERPWSDTAIRDALASGGMRLLAALTPEGIPATDTSGRVVYYAERVSENQEPRTENRL